MKIPQVFIPETKLDKKLEDLLKKSFEKTTKFKKPKVGMNVYVPDFVSKNRFCKIAKIDENHIEIDGEKTIYVSFKGEPYLWCSWGYLLRNQAKWKEEYDNKIRNKF